MKKITVTHLAQLASYRTATEILRTVITECDKMSQNEIERCIESVAVDELSVRIKAHFSDNKNVQLIVGILPEHELSVYDLIGEEELIRVSEDEKRLLLLYRGSLRKTDIMENAEKIFANDNNIAGKD